MASKKKELQRVRLLEYLSNPENEFPTREFMSVNVLGYKHRAQLQKLFTPEELQDIEQEALKNRRKKYASMIARVDKALIERAEQGDPQAIKLVYQRFEGWSEKKQVEANLKQEPLKIEKDKSSNAKD